MNDDYSPLRGGYRRRRSFGRRHGYGWRRCRRCRRRLTDPVSIARGYGPECYPGRGWRGSRSIRPLPTPPNAGPTRAPQKVRRTPPDTPKPPSLGGLERYLSPAVLRSAVIGASCAALPVACPAITAVSTIADLYSAARKIIEEMRGPGGPYSGARAGAAQVWQTLAGKAAAGMAKPAIGFVALSINATLPRSANLATESVRKIVIGTLTEMLSGTINAAGAYVAGAR